MFCDTTQIKIGEEMVTVKRLTISELRTNRAIFAEGKECLEEAYTRLISEHCTKADGTPINAEELSLPQLQKLAKELAGVPDESPISSFIGMLL